MSDLISRQDVIEKINERARETFSLAPGYEHYLGALHDVADDLRQMPSADAVPVVRCKDCKWWDRIDNGSYGYCHACKHAFYSSNWEISIYRRYKEDWFCADGERRADAEQV